MKKLALLWITPVLIVSGFVRLDLWAQERPAPAAPGGKVRHLVFPVKTDLHRFLLGRDAQVFVAVDSTGRVGEAGLDADALKAIRVDLARYRAKDASVRFNVFHVAEAGRGDLDSPTVKEELKTIAVGLDFRVDGFIDEYVNDPTTWPTRIAGLDRDLPGPAGGDETGVNDRAIKVYPVRTPLSRYLTGDADCVVEIVTPSAGKLDPEIEPGIVRAVARLKLARKEKMYFRVLASGEFNLSVAPIPEQTHQLARRLGFPKSSSAVSAAPSAPR
jgi:hypothetical protein